MSSQRQVGLIALAAVCVGWLAGAAPASAQTTLNAAPPRHRPTCRVSLYTQSSSTRADAAARTTDHEVMTSLSCQMPELDDDGIEYGADLRYSDFGSASRPRRLSIYEGFVGARLGGGLVRVRLGHLSLVDLGALGSVAGGVVEARQHMDGAPSAGRLRVGMFAGLEPNIYESGYAPDVRKYGGYVALDGARARRHVVGFVAIRDGSIAERSVLTTMNFVPIGGRFFLYQAAEYDARPPAGQGHPGLTYALTTVRVAPTDRFDLQGSYHRGRSVDTRGISDDILHGRPVRPGAIDGLLFESGGGRVTVTVARTARLYAGYSRDRTNRDDGATGRTLVGGHVGNVAGTGLDLSASDSRHDGPGRNYHSRFVSVGREIGRAYVSADYSTSLAFVRFTRSNGLTIERRPHTKRVSGSVVAYVGGAISLHGTVDRTVSDDVTDLRVLSGISYRLP